jgi:4-amino-4-deoxy-L-arabinose transferase-like glycosyltransferase
MRPLVVTTLQAVKMPRWLVLLLAVLYVVPGFAGRDPWRFADATGFGIAWTMALAPRGMSDWLMPNVLGLAIAETGPAPFWMGAAAMRAVPVLPADVVMRGVGMLWLFGLLAAVWYATWFLTRRPEVQPSDPFGASASPVDFGRALADCSVLVMMATLGLVARSHETTADAAQVACVGLFLLAGAHALERPAQGGALAGVAVALSVLCRGLPVAVALTLTFCALPLLARPYRLVARPMLISFVPVAAMGALLWPLALQSLGAEGAGHLQRWIDWNERQITGVSAATLTAYARNLPWFFWPAWPIAAWAMWRWRARTLQPAVALPAATALLLLVVALLGPGASESAMLPIVPALAMLAALGIPILRRSISSLIDWFSVMSFSALGLALWAYWIAFETGWPPRMAQSAQNAVQGFAPKLDPFELALGLMATAGWIGLVWWRISRQPRALWRTVALSGGGLVLTWFLLMTLWLPAENYRSTYRDVAQQAGAALPRSYRCVRTLGVDAAQRATFAYFGGVRFDDQRADCDWLLVVDKLPSEAMIASVPGTWTPIWRGQRPVDRRERFRLLQRAHP